MGKDQYRTPIITDITPGSIIKLYFTNSAASFVQNDRNNKRIKTTLKTEGIQLKLSMS
jgi:hypothetical protein